MKHLLITVLIIACIPDYTRSQKETVSISNGFMTGKNYLDMSQDQKRAYAMGVINGMLVAPLFGAPEGELAWLRGCTVNMTDGQVAAVLSKYLRDNPGKWHHRMPVLSFDAILDACPDSKTVNP